MSLSTLFVLGLILVGLPLVAVFAIRVWQSMRQAKDDGLTPREDPTSAQYHDHEFGKSPHGWPQRRDARLTLRAFLVVLVVMIALVVFLVGYVPWIEIKGALLGIALIGGYYAVMLLVFLAPLAALGLLALPFVLLRWRRSRRKS